MTSASGVGSSPASNGRSAVGCGSALRSVRRRLLPAILAIIGLGSLAFIPGWVGDWLVLSEPLQQANAVVVLGGHLPYRALEAARIFREGWATEAWVTQAPSAEVDALREMDIGYVAEHEWSRRVLERHGVPAKSIRVLPDAINTTEEVQAILRRLESTGRRRAIIVSSKAHTRRIRETWDALSPNDREAVVRYTQQDRFSPESWWTNTRDALAVTREIGGIVNVCLDSRCRRGGASSDQPVSIEVASRTEA